jgi:hypothetical protein
MSHCFHALEKQGVTGKTVDNGSSHYALLFSSATTKHKVAVHRRFAPRFDAYLITRIMNPIHQGTANLCCIASSLLIAKSRKIATAN